MSSIMMYLHNIRYCTTLRYDVSLMLSVYYYKESSNFEMPKDLQVIYLNSMDDLMINDLVIIRNIPRELPNGYKLYSATPLKSGLTSLTYYKTDIFSPRIKVIYKNRLPDETYDSNVVLIQNNTGLFGIRAKGFVQLQNLDIPRKWAEDIIDIKLCRTFDNMPNRFYPKLSDDPVIQLDKYHGTDSKYYHDTANHYIIVSSDHKYYRLSCNYSHIKDLPGELGEIEYLRNYKWSSKCFYKNCIFIIFSGFEDTIIIT